MKTHHNGPNRWLKHPIWLISFIFIISFFIRYSYRQNGLFHHDSVRLAQAVEKSFEHRRLYPVYLHSPTIGGRYGVVFVNVVLYALVNLFSKPESSETTLVFSSVLFSSLAVVFMFCFVRELYSDKLLALTAALLLSVTPIFLSQSTGAKEHSLSLFINLLVLYLVKKGIRNKSNIILLLSGIFLGFSGFFRVPNLWIIWPFLLIYFLDFELPIKYQWRHIKTNRLDFKMCIYVFVPIVAGLVLLWLVQREWIFMHASYSKFLGLISAPLKSAVRDFIFTMTLPGVIFLFFGFFFLLIRKQTINCFMLVSWFLLYFLYNGNLAIYSPRLILDCLVPAVIFTAVGITGCMRKNTILTILVVVMVAAMMFVRIQPILIFRHNFVGGKELALFVKENTEKDALIIAMDDAPFLEYYGKRETLSHPVGNDRKKLKKMLQVIKEEIEKGRPVYITYSGFSYDPQRLFERSLYYNFKLKKIGSFVTEDYHHASISFRIYKDVLYRIMLK